MLVLPGGRIIDLSTDRSKYHALRQPGVGPTSPHTALYPLVDVLYRVRDENGLPRTGWTEYDFVFSGYTLDSVRHAADWSDADKAALDRWVRLDDQRRRVETARRRLTESQPQLSRRVYSAPHHLFSLLRRRLFDLPQKRASATQWLATLSNMQGQGVRDEELEWSGLRRFLQELAADTMVEKKTLLKQLNLRPIRLELTTEQIWGANGGLNFREVARRMPHQAVYRAALKLDANCLCVQRYEDSCYNYRVGVVKTLHNGHPMALNKFWFALDPYGRAVPNTDAEAGNALLFANSLDAKLAADRHARKHFDIRSGASHHTRYDHLTLFGGHDYREWLVSLPDYQRSFFGAHFFDHNVVAHIRTTTRSDTMGRKLLFIEEVQSDWHQSGSRHGYDNCWWGTVANAPFKKEWTALAAKLMLIHASENGYAGIAWPPGAIQELRYMRSLAPIKQHYDREIPYALDRLGRPFQCRVESTHIPTREPWLNMERHQEKWRVADGQGKFKTKAKYQTRDDAMAVIARHCRAIDLAVPAFFISDELRCQIAEHGLPLFGNAY